MDFKLLDKYAGNCEANYCKYVAYQCSNLRLPIAIHFFYWAGQP
jgi:hypothetical protein